MTAAGSGIGGPVVLAAGGTGGHMFPAEALARELLARGAEVALVTDRRGHAFGDALPEVAVHRIRAGTPTRGTVGRVKAVAELGVGYLQARRLLRRLKPAVVVGFGGYPSVPTVMAAARAGLPAMVHEQNAVLGRANRLLAPRVAAVATAFPGVQGLRAGDRDKALPVGNPVRPAIAGLAARPYALPAGGEPIRLLVLGGSQGAHVFAEAVPAALARLPEALRRQLQVSQQCRPEDLDAVERAYGETGIERALSSFFRDVPERLAAAHLAIARAGASTIAELAAAGRPAILVPYPYATDDHQTANASALADAGGAWMLRQPDLTPETLSSMLQALFEAPATLAEAARGARSFARIDAARDLADAALRLARGGGADGENGPPGYREAAQ
jgi:UDP-N-acetylglucosamine--N-acetylmuramyl-(pentapeptide) pyrophosphoryl-undecaprenol N-acetylglucosamine transferase